MKLCWYGNATINISTKNTSFITDPFITRNPALPPLQVEDVKKAKHILVGHGHFDHIVDIPDFVKEVPIPIYTTERVGNMLVKNWGVDKDLIKAVKPGDSFEVEDARLTVFSARHVKFDLPLIASTAAKILKPPYKDKFRMLKKNLADHKKCPMCDCIAWQIEYEDKKLLHFSSLALEPGENYPQDTNILCLPFQGHSRLDLIGEKVVQKIPTEAVFAHHFDDAFPPISSHVDLTPFKELMAEKQPEVKIIVPKYRQEMEL